MPYLKGRLEEWTKLHAGLKKVKGSLILQMRTVKAFLYAKTLPGVERASCTCGWGNRAVKLVLIFCPEREESRREILKAAETKIYEMLLTTDAGSKAIPK